MTLGFVIVRHVNNQITNEYWIESYKCIRKYYDYPILIVDDNSVPEFLSENIITQNCTVIKSEYPGRGQFLGYYYFYKTHFVDRACIIHDTVFLNSNTPLFDHHIKFLWSGSNHHNNNPVIISLINKLNNSDKLLSLYHHQKKWLTCFGNMSTIDHFFLLQIDIYFNFFQILLENITDKYKQLALEKIYECVCIYMYPNLQNSPNIFGNIINYK